MLHFYASTKYFFQLRHFILMLDTAYIALAVYRIARVTGETLALFRCAIFQPSGKIRFANQCAAERDQRKTLPQQFFSCLARKYPADRKYRKRNAITPLKKRLRIKGRFLSCTMIEVNPADLNCVNAAAFIEL